MSLATPRKGYKSVKWYFGKYFEIPEEWNINPFSDGIKFLTDYEANGSYAKLDEFAKVGVGKPFAWFVRSTDLEKERWGLVEGNKFVNKDSYDFLHKTKLFGDELLIMKVGSIGNIYLMPKVDCSATLGNNLYLIFTNDNLISKFAYYWFKSHFGLSSLFRIASTTTIPSINKDNTKSNLILFPTVKEQQKIVTILSNVDNLIESTEQVIENSKKVKTGLMQKLLTRGIGHTKFKKVPWLFGKEIEIPEEWEIVIIKKLVTFHKQGLYTTQPYSKNGIKIARVNDLENPNLSYDKMNNLELDPKTFDSFKISKGDFLIARTGNIGNYGIVTEDIECVHISDIIRFNFNLNELLNEYFGLFFESHLLLVQLLMIQQSSSHIHINAETMKSLKIPLPPLSEQQKISSILSNIDSKITSQEQYKEKLEKLKKSLMQKLLTGEVRV